ncbi:MAG: 2Fe-2S iron-sulfur cluster-binding protein, partial [Myxococcota bacterium]
MPPRRMGPLGDTVVLQVDGAPVRAARGEPVAVALAAAGRLVLGRSVKYHRPRGAVCFRGRCEGCLMRVDGRPNVATCRTPATSGLRVETQNVVGSAEADLLAATDWFFPEGMDHHHMFTRFRPVNELMQKVARRIAGVGTLPDEAVPPVAPRERDVDVLVVGAGPAGVAAANAAAAGGARVLIVDEEPVPGGAARLRGLPVAALGPPVQRAFAASALGLWDEVGAGFSGGREEAASELRWYLVGDRRGVTRIRARRLVLAPGATPASLPLPGADRPGVFTAEGAWALLSHGVLPGEDVAVVHV